jgi:hypothetical protein
MDIPVTRAVPPGDTITFRVQMRAPKEPGTYDELWEFRDSNDKPITVRDRTGLPARVVVPEPEVRVCGPGESTATQLVKKFIDGIYRTPGERFRYGWTLKNDGLCAWPVDATFRFVSHTRGRLSDVQELRPIRSIRPGETFTFLVPIQAPRQPGTYQEFWQFREAAGTVIPVDGAATVNLLFRIPQPEIPVAQIHTCRPGEAKVRFVDETWLDHTKVSPGQTLTKRWTIFNIGDCAWGPDFRLRFVSSTGPKLSISQADLELGEVVPPWTTYTFDVPMRMPGRPGSYREDWRFIDAHGNHIFVSGVAYVYAILNVVQSDSR